jgi:Tetracyclin repressor-like, C-terminal domain
VDTTDRDWASQLRVVAHHFRALALEHPNMLPLLVTRPLAIPLGQWPPGTLRPLEDVLTLLNSAGFIGDDVLHVTGCCSPCTATSSTNCTRSSSNPKKRITSYSSGCIGCRSSNSPEYVHWPALASYDGAAELDRGLDLLLTGLTAAFTHPDGSPRTSRADRRLPRFPPRRADALATYDLLPLSRLSLLRRTRVWRAFPPVGPARPVVAASVHLQRS